MHKKNILYFDQENDAWEAFHYRAAAALRGPRLRKSHSDPYRTRGEALQEGHGGLKWEREGKT